MKICIWGNELNSWVSGAMFAQCGNQVIFSDSKNWETSEKDSQYTFSEPGLNKLIEEQENLGRITFCNSATAKTYTQ